MSLNDSLHEHDFEDLSVPLTGSAARAPPYPPAPDYQSAQRYRDPVFAVLFIGHALIVTFFAAVKGIPAIHNGGIPEIEVNPDHTNKPEDDSDDPVPLILGLTLLMVLGSFFSTVWIKVLIAYGESLIRWTLLSTVAWFILCAVAAAVARAVFGAVGLIVLAGISYWYYRSIDSRIEFAGKNLKVACTAVRAMPGTVTAAVVLLVAQTVWCIVWSLALVGVATNYSQKYITGLNGQRYVADTCTTYSTVGPDPSFSPNCSSAAAGLCFKCVCAGTTVLPDAECMRYSVNSGVYAAMLLSLLWGCAVIAAAAHCTAAGAVAAWWFNGALPGSGRVTNGHVGGHVGASLKRAATTSLGSLCMAALLTAVARCLRIAVNSLKSRRRGMGSLGVALVECCVHLAERLLRIFNRYALCYVAIYGSDLRTAGRETYDLFARRGWATIINDQLVDNVLSLGCTVVAVICSLCGFLIAKLLGMSSVLTAVLVSFGLFMGYSLASIAMSVVSSAVATIYVCFAQDQDAFASSHHELWAELMHSWNKAHGPTMAQCGYALATQAS